MKQDLKCAVKFFYFIIVLIESSELLDILLILLW